MKKLINTGTLGGAPIDKKDLREVFNDEIWDAIEALLSPFSSDTQGIVVSGCVTTANAGNFDMTAGIVFLNGEFMRISAATNQTFTKYIAPATATVENRTLASGATADITQTKTAELVGSAPGGSQYITIASLTDLDDRRWKPQTADINLRKKIIEIGDWDMDATSQVTIAHGVADFTKIRSVTLMIRNDAASILRQSSSPFDASGSIVDGAGVLTISTTNIVLERKTSGFYDGANFDSTSFNRGWITVEYEA